MLKTFIIVVLCQLGLLSGGNACVVPDAPTKGSYSFPDSHDAPVPGSTAQESQILYYECLAPNVLQGGPTIICENGNWLPEIPRCLVPSDCGDILGNISGVYLIQPSRNREPFDVYCDLTLDGQKWTVIQQRLSKDIDFYKNYTAYSDGFGTKVGNHWLGLEHIHEITKGGHHELYVELDTYTRRKVYARYDTFIVGNSSTGFQLTISGYNGTAGDSMYKHGDSEWTNNGMKFTTFDKDQDEWSGGNCAEGYEGGWWYNNCGASHLNGPYEDTAVWGWKTIFWLDKFGYDALKRARMLIRRK